MLSIFQHQWLSSIIIGIKPPKFGTLKLNSIHLFENEFLMTEKKLLAPFIAYFWDISLKVDLTSHHT